MRMRKSAFLFLLLSFWMLPGVSASAQSNISAPCPNMGERQASAADIPLMRAAGYPPELLNVGQCWNPSSPYVGQEAGEVKLFLQKNATKNEKLASPNTLRTSSTRAGSFIFFHLRLHLFKLRMQREEKLSIATRSMQRHSFLYQRRYTFSNTRT